MESDPELELLLIEEEIIDLENKLTNKKADLATLKNFKSRFPNLWKRLL